MGIASFFTGIDAGCVDLCIHPRIVRVLLINVKVTAEDFKLSSHSAEHHVFHRKGGLRMGWVNFPGHLDTPFIGSCFGRASHIARFSSKESNSSGLVPIKYSLPYSY